MLRDGSLVVLFLLHFITETLYSYLTFGDFSLRFLDKASEFLLKRKKAQ